MRDKLPPPCGLAGCTGGATSPAVFWSPKTVSKVSNLPFDVIDIIHSYQRYYDGWILDNLDVDRSTRSNESIMEGIDDESNNEEDEDPFLEEAIYNLL